MVEKVLSKLDLQHSFDLVITKEDVARHKPDPEAYLLALSHLRVSANDTPVFEDSNRRAGGGNSGWLWLHCSSPCL